jgi:predicted kinase
LECRGVARSVCLRDRSVKRPAHCDAAAKCVTSLNMRKWMRERLQRRKKKDPEQAGEAAPPPLQPAYFDTEDAPKPPLESREAESNDVAEPAFASRREDADAPRAESQSGVAASSTGEEARRGRGRRRRGGRGRGGRGREQAVAQAFAPAAVKGKASEIAEQTAEGSEEPEASAGEAPVAVPQASAPPAVVPEAPLRAPKGIVVLAIGLPGSGKSTWFKRHNVVPLSSDMVRSLLFDDVREQRFQDLVFSNLRSMLKARLIAKRPMNYVDATNLTPQERAHWVKLAKDYKYEVQAVFFDVPLEVCVERHQRRDRVVPEDVMRRMAAKLKAPSFQEGFSKITVVRVKKKEQEAAEAADSA